MSTAKGVINRLLGRVIDRRRFDDGPIYTAYLRLCKPATHRARRAETDFYRGLIPAGAATVFDIGANVGHKTVVFARHCGKVVSVEPNPAAVEHLRARFRDNPKVVVVPKGVAATAGSASFHAFGPESSCYSTFSPKWADAVATGPAGPVAEVVTVPVTTVDDLIAEHGPPDYLKIDVEGYEDQVLAGLSRPVAVVGFECNLPTFARETLDCVRKLASLSARAEFNYTTTEPPTGFASDAWLSADEMARVVERGGHGFLEIFCRTPV